MVDSSVMNLPTHINVETSWKNVSGRWKVSLKNFHPQTLEGPEDAEVTLIGWGSTHGVIAEAVELLSEEDITTNHIQFKWLYPMDEDVVNEVLEKTRYAIIVECNYTGQFARFLRSETGFKADGHIRKYDGEPFMPHHIVDGTRELLESKSELYVPYQEIVV